MFEDLVKRLATLGYDTTPDDNWLLNFVITKAEKYLKANLNVDTIPDDLYLVWLDMAAAEFLGTKQFSESGGQIIDGVIKQIQEGDTSVTYDTSSDSLSSNSSMDKILAENEFQLSRFRKISWM